MRKPTCVRLFARLHVDVLWRLRVVSHASGWALLLPGAPPGLRWMSNLYPLRRSIHREICPYGPLDNINYLRTPWSVRSMNFCPVGYACSGG